MSPEQTFEAIKKALREAVTEVPDSLLSSEPDEYWTDLVARLVTKLSGRGFYVVERAAYDLVRTQVYNRKPPPKLSQEMTCPDCGGSGGGNEPFLYCVRCSGVGRVNPS